MIPSNYTDAEFIVEVSRELSFSDRSRLESIADKIEDMENNIELLEEEIEDLKDPEESSDYELLEEARSIILELSEKYDLKEELKSEYDYEV